MSDDSGARLKSQIISAAADMLEDAVSEGVAREVYLPRRTVGVSDETFATVANGVVGELRQLASDVEPDGSHLWWYELPGEDWFVIAPSEREAAAFVETNEACGPSDYRLRWVATVPDQMPTGWPDLPDLRKFDVEIVRPKAPVVARLGDDYFVQGENDWQIAKSWDDLYDDHGLGRPHGTHRDDEPS